MILTVIFRQVSPLPVAAASKSHLRNEINTNEQASEDQLRADDEQEEDDHMSIDEESDAAEQDGAPVSPYQSDGSLH